MCRYVGAIFLPIWLLLTTGLVKFMKAMPGRPPPQTPLIPLSPEAEITTAINHPWPELPKAKAKPCPALNPKFHEGFSRPDDSTKPESYVIFGHQTKCYGRSLDLPIHSLHGTLSLLCLSSHSLCLLPHSFRPCSLEFHFVITQPPYVFKLFTDAPPPPDLNWNWALPQGHGSPK